MSNPNAFLEKLAQAYEAKVLIKDGPLPNTTEALLVTKHNIPLLVQTAAGTKSARTIGKNAEEATALLEEKLEASHVLT